VNCQEREEKAEEKQKGKEKEDSVQGDKPEAYKGDHEGGFQIIPAQKGSPAEFRIKGFQKELEGFTESSSLQDSPSKEQGKGRDHGKVKEKG
jgi:hypothetical protein